MRIVRSNSLICILLSGILIILGCFALIGFIPFYAIAHGDIFWAIDLIVDFYLFAGINYITLLWYSAIFTVLIVGWIVYRRVKHNFTITKIGVILFFLVPTVFINPPPSYLAAIAYPQKYADINTDYVIVPTIVSIAGYLLDIPYNSPIFIVSAISVALWPLFIIGIVTQFSIMIRNKVRETRTIDSDVVSTRAL